jgi:hypothetical protein
MNCSLQNALNCICSVESIEFYFFWIEWFRVYLCSVLIHVYLSSGRFGLSQNKLGCRNLVLISWMLWINSRHEWILIIGLIV